MAEIICVFILFVLLSGINVYCNKKELRKGIIFTKPLLMPMLLLFYLVNVKYFNWMLTAALICGFLGDVFLLKDGMFFILGLLSFLIGHIFYLISFLQDININLIPTWHYLLILPYVIIAVVIGRKLLPGAKKLMPYVIIYLFAIFAMSFASLIRFWSVSGWSFLLIFLGTIFFIISDSMLALNEFNKKIHNIGVYVMATYILAQFMIVSGMLNI